MSISFDKALGIHERRWAFVRNAEVLANNIANADTPNYKARDLDFGSVLAEQSAQSQGGFGVTRTSDRHIAAEGLEIADASCVFAPRLIPPWTRTPSICRSSNPTTRRTPSTSRRASPCSTASSRG